MNNYTITPVLSLKRGDIVAFDEHEPIWVTVLKVQRDRQGFDVLYQHDGSEPHWRGFDDGDTVLRKFNADY